MKILDFLWVSLKRKNFHITLYIIYLSNEIFAHENGMKIKIFGQLDKNMKSHVAKILHLQKLTIPTALLLYR